MGSYAEWLHILPGLFMVAIGLMFWGFQSFEKKIRDREEELRN